MNEAKFQSIMTNQSAVAKKIYDAVPVQEAWTTNQIVSELHRRNVGVGDKRIIQGALANLKDSKLIREPSAGKWIRAQIHKRPNLAPVPMEEPVVEQKPEPTDALDKLLSLAERVRSEGSALVALAKEIGEVALEVQSQLEASDEETKKLRQLAKLLKDLD